MVVPVARLRLKIIIKQYVKLYVKVRREEGDRWKVVQK